MGVETIVCRGFGVFGGGINKLPTRGYAIGAPVVLAHGPLFTVAAQAYNVGAVAAQVYTPGAVAAQAEEG